MRREILRLAWPVFVAQLAVMANGVIDTVMAGRLSAVDMAAIGLGASIYVTLYIGLMGTLLGLSPIVGQHFGAGRFAEIGASYRQSVWLALALSAFSSPPEAVASTTRVYLWATAAGLPAALLFRTFNALNVAISRPRVVMWVNLASLSLKVPLNTLFMHGWSEVGLPAMGGAGCGVATAVLAWCSAIVAAAILLRDPRYALFEVARWSAPCRSRLRELLALGLPIGAAYVVEITSFTFMALFIARLGPSAAASHQVASNLAGICYMVGLGIAHATSTLVAHSIGAGDRPKARRYALTGLSMALVAALVTLVVLWSGSGWIAGAYSSDHAVVSAAIPLIAMVALFHLFDSLQTQCGFILRAYKVATAPMVVYLVTMWGVGLGGGYWLTYLSPRHTVFAAFSGSTGGALGFWVAGFASLVLATLGLALLLNRVWRLERLAPARA